MKLYVHTSVPAEWVQKFTDGYDYCLSERTVEYLLKKFQIKVKKY